MRTSRLADIEIEGREQALALLPLFDFYRLSRVKRLSLEERDSEAGEYDLHLTALYEDGGQQYIVTLRFTRVRRAQLPELTPSFYLGELELENIARDQLEGIRYRARDYGSETFEVLCQGIAVSVCTEEP